MTTSRVLRFAIAAALFAASATAAAVPALAFAQEPEAAPFDATIRESLPEAFTLYRELLRLPNDAHHPEDIERLVALLEEALRQRGFATERLPTPGSPLLLAERRHANPR